MTGTPVLAALIAVFAQLSLLSFGGGNAIISEMQRQVVQVHPWMTAGDFAALFALAQAAPGPNLVLVATLVGWRVAGLAGAFCATLAICAPAAVLTFATASLWHRFRDAPWRRIVQQGLVSVTAGLITASAVLLTESTTTGWVTALVTAVATVVLLRTKVNPLFVLGAGAALGVLGVVG